LQLLLFVKFDRNSQKSAENRNYKLNNWTKLASSENRHLQTLDDCQSLLISLIDNTDDNQQVNKRVK